MTVNLRSFKKKFNLNRKALRSFLTRVENNPPRQLHKTMVELDKEVWAQTDCLDCGNCCKKMTPTFTEVDIKRIAGHFSMTPDEFKKKWLVYEKKEGDWQNVKQPCQFLNLTDNKCSIYAIRPADCSGFPHHTKKTPTDYMHVYKQNLEYCPATYRLVEKMQERLSK
ncbi:MAG: YkgJ family cysteine cluster protein [Bacteroidota bacterium]